MKRDRFGLVVVTMVTCVFFAACDHRSMDRRKHVIRWEGGVNLYSVVFFMDDVQIGRGKLAFQKLMENLEALPDGTNLVFRYPADIANLLRDHYQALDPLPYEGGFEAERQAFGDLWGRKHFVLEI